MKILCLFRQCRWRFICNAGQIGLYQCATCKTVSIGSPRPFEGEKPYDARAHQAMYP